MITTGTKPPIAGPSDLAFCGDLGRWNPLELLLAPISACNTLVCFGLCAKSGFSVVSYRDEAGSAIIEDTAGADRSVSAVLRPVVIIQAVGDIAEATRLHHDAHDHCFIANSVNFPVTSIPVIPTQ